MCLFILCQRRIWLVINLKCSWIPQTSTDTDVRRPQRDEREVQPKERARTRACILNKRGEGYPPSPFLHFWAAERRLRFALWAFYFGVETVYGLPNNGKRRASEVAAVGGAFSRSVLQCGPNRKETEWCERKQELADGCADQGEDGGDNQKED
jgi:hypothetical protein